MRKIVLTLVMVGLLAGNAFAGGLWDMVKNSGGELRKSKQLTIEVAGTDIRAYVFDVPEMKSVCINVWGNEGQTLECKTYKEMGDQ